MSDPQNLDQVKKSIGKMVADWGRSMDDIAEKIEKLQAEIKADSGKQASADAAKEKEKIKKEIEEKNKEVVRNILALKIPPAIDPKQGAKLPALITSHFDENGVKINDYVSILPSVKLDLKKGKITDASVTATITF